MAPNPLLSIDTAGNTETIIIDEQEYSLTDFDAFSVIDQHKIGALGRRILELTGKDLLTDAMASDLIDTADDLFARVSGDIPEEVKAKLKPGARMRITSAYFLAFRGARPVEPESETASENGQPESSPDSSDSTEEGPTTG